MIVECGQPRQKQKYQDKHEHTIIHTRQSFFKQSSCSSQSPHISTYHHYHRYLSSELLIHRLPHAFGDFHVSRFPSNRRLSFLPSLMRSAPPFLSASSLFVSQSSIPHLTRPSFHRSCTSLFFSNLNIGVTIPMLPGFLYNLFHCKNYRRET